MVLPQLRHRWRWLAELTGRLSRVGTPPPSARPAPVTAAGVVALASCVVVATALVVVMVTLLGDASQAPAGLRVDVARRLAIALLVWSVVGAVLAWRTLRGSSRARVALVVSAALAGSASLTLSAVVAGALLAVVACLTTMVLLFSAGARAWFREQRTAG